jgi:hypothetical protein
MFLVVFVALLSPLAFEEYLGRETKGDVLFVSPPSFLVSRRCEVSDLVQFCFPLSDTHWFRKPFSVALETTGAEQNETSSISSFISPAMLLKKYAAEDTGEAHPESSLATVEISSGWRSSDIALFVQKFGGAKTIKKIYGTPNWNNESSIEGTMDLQLALSLSPANRDFRVYNFKGNGSFAGNMEALFCWAALVNADPSPPKIISISFGMYSNPPLDQTQRFNLELEKMKNRGIVVLFAAGDTATGFNGTSFVAPYPSSWYATLVGGTRIVNQSEIVWEFSQSGFR